MYRYRYINKHEQFSRTCYTLILQDLEGSMPDIRIEKEFGMLAKDIDEDILYKEASKEIQIAQQAYDSLAVSDNAEGEE